MSNITALRMGDDRSASSGMSKIKLLVGSGDKIALFTLPTLVIAVGLNLLYPAIFRVGRLSPVPMAIAVTVLIAGITIWLWSVVLILTRVPKGELITSGPFALMMHPLYTGVSLLVLPSLGLLLGSWLGAVVGIALYVGSRKYAPEEEMALAATFGSAWDEYCKQVMVPWL